MSMGRSGCCLYVKDNTREEMSVFGDSFVYAKGRR
jgi:hypothetical protein